MHRCLLLLLLLCALPCCAADLMLESFDDLTPAQLAARVTPLGAGVTASLVPTDERAGKQNLLLTAELDPVKKGWNGVRFAIPRSVALPQTLSLWYRGDKATELYFVLQDSRGQRGDFQVGADAPRGTWQQAVIPLGKLHVPNGVPPNDRMAPADIASLEIYPVPGAQPAAGTYHFQLDDLSVAASGAPGQALTAVVLFSPVANGDFARLRPDGEGFSDWDYTISREARCTLAVDPRGGHGGGAAPLFHSTSATAPHVYARFLQRVSVIPAMAYRLTYWCRGEDVGGGSHFTDWKTYNSGLPSGTFGWRQCETQFTTAPDQSVLELGLNVTNRTGRLWVDDVALTPDYSGCDLGGGGRLVFWTPRQLAADREELAFRMGWSALPLPGSRVHLSVRCDGKTVGLAETGVEAADGEASGSLKVEATAFGPATVTAEALGADGKTLGSAQRQVQIVSAAGVRSRLSELRTQLTLLQRKMAAWRQRGLPVDYPRVTETVATNFLPWIEGDVDHGETARALQQCDELADILRAALAQCDDPPAASALRVPRYRGGPIGIEHEHFVADTVWPDGTAERRPVFFNGYGHFGAVRRDLEKFPAYGLNILQVEFGPSSVVQPDMSTRLDAVEEFVKLLDRGAQAGVAVNLLISPHYMPDWVYQKWPEVGGVNGGFVRYDIDAPQTRQVLETFLRAAIPLLKGKPALHSICLSNEPIYVDAGKSAYNRQKWHAWLAARHGTISALNAAWGTNYADFEAVPVHPADELEPCGALYDWMRFNNERFAAWHAWLAGIIHSIAPEIPLHAKPMNLPFDRNTLCWGNDPEQFCGFSQVAGNDASNAYNHDEASLWANGWQREYQWYDLLRSMRGQPVFNSENHVVGDRNWRPVPGIHERNLVWEGALHGLGASTTWVWERTYDNRSDFAGSIMHRPAMCDAHGRAALDLMRLAPEVVALQRARPRVAIVYSLCSQSWNPLYMGALNAVYQWLSLAGEKVEFVTAGQLAEGRGARYRVIVAPRVTHLEPEAVAALAAFAQRPRHTVLTVGDKCLAADQYNRPQQAAVKQTVLPAEVEAAGFRAALAAALANDFPVTLTDVATGRAPDGVGWQWTRQGRRWLVNACNLTRHPVRLRLECGGARKLTNLFTGRPLGTEVTLGMLESVLVAGE